MDDFEKTLDRVLAGKDREPKNGPVDLKDIKEAEADIIAGRDKDPDIWRQVMQHWGFRWLEPAELDRTIGPEQVKASIEGAHGEPLYWTRPHTVGQWRSNKHRLAFTLKDLTANFQTPETFHRWLQKRVQDALRKRAS